MVVESVALERLQDGTQYKARPQLWIKIEIRGFSMEAWKKAVVAGSAGVAAVLLLKKRWPAGVLTAGVGLAVLASEYPEKFESLQESLPQ